MAADKCFGIVVPVSPSHGFNLPILVGGALPAMAFTRIPRRTTAAVLRGRVIGSSAGVVSVVSGYPMLHQRAMDPFVLSTDRTGALT